LRVHWGAFISSLATPHLCYRTSFCPMQPPLGYFSSVLFFRRWWVWPSVLQPRTILAGVLAFHTCWTEAWSPFRFGLPLLREVYRFSFVYAPFFYCFSSLLRLSNPDVFFSLPLKARILEEPSLPEQASANERLSIFLFPKLACFGGVFVCCVLVFCARSLCSSSNDLLFFFPWALVLWWFCLPRFFPPPIFPPGEISGEGYLFYSLSVALELPTSYLCSSFSPWPSLISAR